MALDTQSDQFQVFYRETTAAESAAARRIVWLFGWLGCTVAQLEHYSRLYLGSFGFHVAIQTLPSKSYARHPDEGTQSELEKAFDFLERHLPPVLIQRRRLGGHDDECFLKDCELVTHHFSNGGNHNYIAWLSLLDVSARLRCWQSILRATIFDSSPSHHSHVTYGRAKNAHIVSPYRRLTNELRDATLSFLASPFLGGLAASSDDLAGFPYLLYAASHVNVPKLFFYSVQDRISNRKYIEWFVGQLRNLDRRLGRRITVTHRFYDSPHVLHSRRYPADYLLALQFFLANSLLPVNRRPALPSRL